MSKILEKEELKELLKSYKLLPLLDLSGYFIYCYGLMYFFSKNKKISKYQYLEQQLASLNITIIN